MIESKSGLSFRKDGFCFKKASTFSVKTSALWGSFDPGLFPDLSAGGVEVVIFSHPESIARFFPNPKERLAAQPR